MSRACVSIVCVRVFENKLSISLEMMRKRKIVRCAVCAGPSVAGGDAIAPGSFKWNDEYVQIYYWIFDVRFTRSRRHTSTMNSIDRGDRIARCLLSALRRFSLRPIQTLFIIRDFPQTINSIGRWNCYRWSKTHFCELWISILVLRWLPSFNANWNPSFIH